MWRNAWIYSAAKEDPPEDYIYYPEAEFQYFVRTLSIFSCASAAEQFKTFNSSLLLASLVCDLSLRTWDALLCALRQQEAGRQLLRVPSHGCLRRRAHRCREVLLLPCRGSRLRL